ncbi:acyltransferase [Corallincola luteus]|uniref:Acyltransferase n=1 Tax=Corallincola luteus TaxID=1775177 RepID=A0ABY2AST6_9GAMM|nr:acyltransferase [Corallincola luteus]
MVRGLFRLRAFISIGSGVSLYGKRQLQLGRGVTIAHQVTIDALGLGGIEIGTSSSIGSFSLLKVSGSFANLGLSIRIGENVGIGEFAHIGGAGGVSIGNDTIIGAYFSVHPENHNFSDLSAPIRLQGVNHQGISIGNNCWIGAKVTVLDGAVVGDGCVIAAGAVVKGAFPDNCIIGGVPARILKYRHE